ncbi:group 1 truncated hemoglobin [Oceanicella sp. SM1341]|uniref:group I truncated hemoglobin n=1 Tax=Oceanicella sp. SM1341 TaxID=1548889 RepID=UPI000E492A64|nr:group 1 truncated hemoglobin [Oceanicella sp. SM1341]
MAGSLFEKYGGFRTVSKIVMSFYERALDSDQIGDYFADVDMPRLMDHQTRFISGLMGGPASIGDDRLRQVHRHLGISHADMDEMASLLRETLAGHGVEPADIETLVGEVEARRPLIVTAGAAG